VGERELDWPHQDRSALIKVLGLSWNLVICEDYDAQVFSHLEAADSADELTIEALAKLTETGILGSEQTCL